MAKAKKPVEMTTTIVEETTSELVNMIESAMEEIAPVEEPVIVAETAKPMKVGARCKQLLLEGELDNKGILEQIKKEYPDAKTSIACIAWYKSDLKKTKVDPDQGYKDWLKLMEKDLRAEYEATLVKA